MSLLAREECDSRGGCSRVVDGVKREGASGANPIDEVFQHCLVSIGSNGDN
jgi:hypothetical protein